MSVGNALFIAKSAVWVVDTQPAFLSCLLLSPILLIEVLLLP